MMQGAIPKSAVIVARKCGRIMGPGSPNHGKPAEIRWHQLRTGCQCRDYIEVYIEGRRVVRKSASGRNVALWRKAYEDMAQIIG